MTNTLFPKTEICGRCGLPAVERWAHTSAECIGELRKECDKLLRELADIQPGVVVPMDNGDTVETISRALITEMAKRK